jgi:hypothetical protein
MLFNLCRNIREILPHLFVICKDGLFFDCLTFVCFFLRQFYLKRAAKFIRFAEELGKVCLRNNEEEEEELKYLIELFS